MHDDTELSFSLQTSSDAKAPGPALDFSDQQTITLHIRNVTSQKLRGLDFAAGDNQSFTVAGDNCPRPPLTFDPNASCEIRLQFTRPAPAPASNTIFNGTLTITVDSIYQQSGRRVAKIVPLTAKVTATGDRGAPVAANPSFLEHNNLLNLPLNTESLVSAMAAGTNTLGTGGSTGGASATPQWITNFGALGTAIGGLKSGMSFSSSSTQPSPQSFEVLLENELRKKSFAPYMSTSTLFVDKAVNALTRMLGYMTVYANDVSNWQTVCKPAAATTKAPGECGFPIVAANLAAAQQLTTGYTALLQSSSDGAGNMVLLDILHGAMLYQLFPCRSGAPTCDDSDKQKIPSLQVAVAAAGGSTRVNAYFLLNIFYLPRPSYNGGAIVTFELRDEENTLKQAGARTAFYDYNKHWLGDHFVHLDKTDRRCGALKQSDGKTPSDPETFCVPD